MGDTPLRPEREHWADIVSVRSDDGVQTPPDAVAAVPAPLDSEVSEVEPEPPAETAPRAAPTARRYSNGRWRRGRGRTRGRGRVETWVPVANAGGRPGLHRPGRPKHEQAFSLLTLALGTDIRVNVILASNIEVQSSDFWRQVSSACY